ncbi:phosphatidylinositol-binding clathrin assembly protein-like [Sinocyclocheilus grahami]|nr:PREDICTED: phosphatidylinositol-binding clathrin assembly protein-like [Sinocyclocheilus grahami]
MTFPATTPTGMMGYGMPPQMPSMSMMTQPTMMYTQPVMRPSNPFGSVSSAQTLHYPISSQFQVSFINVSRCSLCNTK